MNILILGEFSAFAKNLALGINKIGGHNVVVMCNGDSFKNIKQDENSIVFPEPHNITLFGVKIPRTLPFNAFWIYLKSRKSLKKFKSFFDAVFIINCRFIRDDHERTSPYCSIKDIQYICRPGARVIMSACGADLPFFKFAIADKRFSTVYVNGIPNEQFYRRKEELALKIVDGVIPMSYQYAEAYRLYGKDFKLLPAIQLPFDVSSVPVKDFKTQNKQLIVFNGALRPTKGSVFIEKALEIVKQKYGDKIVIINERYPYDVFLRKLKEIDLYVDLCTDYDYGMSALAAMSAGCVVFSGNTRETKLEINLGEEIPVVPISPDVDDIVNKLSYYIDNKDEIVITGKKSREYVERYHECSIVAQKYLNCFK